MKTVTLARKIKSLDEHISALKKERETLCEKLLGSVGFNPDRSQETIDLEDGLKVVLSRSKSYKWSDINKALEVCERLTLPSINPIKVSYGVDKKKLDIASELSPEILDLVETRQGNISVKVKS